MCLANEYLKLEILLGASGTFRQMKNPASVEFKEEFILKRTRYWQIFCYVVCAIYFIARSSLVIVTQLVCFRMGWSDKNC